MERRFVSSSNCLTNKPIRAAEHAPIEIAQLVTGLVGAVLGELHREAAERRPMDPRQEPFYDTLGDDLDAPQTRHFGGVEQI